MISGEMTSEMWHAHIQRLHKNVKPEDFWRKGPNVYFRLRPGEKGEYTGFHDGQYGWVDE